MSSLADQAYWDNLPKRCIVCETYVGPNKKNLYCSRCEETTGIAHYCSRSCQRKHWPSHKIVCVDIKTTPITRVEGEQTISSIQAAIDAAPIDSVVIIPVGRFKGSSNDEKIVIRKPIKLFGDGDKRTILECDLHILGGDQNASMSSSSLVIARLAVMGKIEVDVPPTEVRGDLTFFAVMAAFRVDERCSAHSCIRFHIISLPETVLNILSCDIIGGTDGIVIEEGASAAAVSIHGTTIEGAKNRGIFSTPPFFLKDCKVHSLGRYSIEGRSEWHSIGDNDIQPGYSSPPYKHS
mmetsp:Transcript_37003/g.44586  ORF Transcript_37003/g.44586 Transcript_37003/m.44586 type:complete len:294 (+) Transcript_37003:92-973(+)|eukprot:CAMPEP_0194375362 /NCGR_PEP_ID=MMETSP0174-20130528/23850_1 /TAXON_ID=216777 /ORGANISM="Proboscia alata, Strain PI-D3" /LENGTH=293 /DNA_ID=CAMNT_0039155491 /DNA_START=29 /DNA_END=910 /DNA_ORIENTATION=+